jgi:hypothetical protein
VMPICSIMPFGNVIRSSVQGRPSSCLRWMGVYAGPVAIRHCRNVRSLTHKTWPRGRTSKMHPPTVIVSWSTAESRSAEADPTSAAGDAAPAEVTSAETTTAEATSAAVASCPAGVRQDDRSDAN